MPEARATCEHRVRCGNEGDSRRGAPRTFCGACGVGLAGVVSYLTDYQKRWGEGKVVDALPPGHPDRIVSNQKEALRVAKRHGIDVNTGTFKSEAHRRRLYGDAAKLNDWGQQRVGVSPGSKRENKRAPIRIHKKMTQPLKPKPVAR